jgi:predicted transposase/invertase (TIGR01784 family)
MRIGIRPTNDYAFKKTFGVQVNELALISLLNAILNLPDPIQSVTIRNPFSVQDFEEDKLSVLDVLAQDTTGAYYHIEVQLSVLAGLIQRIVYYTCDTYAAQLSKGEQYLKLTPVYSICLLDGVLWRDTGQLQHAFRLTDKDSGRVLDQTIEIHFLELGKYNLKESDLATASVQDRWLFWLLHAHEYQPEELLRLFPEAAFQQATETLIEIQGKTEDRMRYDAREKALRDQQWALAAAHLAGEQEGLDKGKVEGKIEGKIEGEIKLIRVLEGLLKRPAMADDELSTKSLDELSLITIELQRMLRERPQVS